MSSPAPLSVTLLSLVATLFSLPLCNSEGLFLSFALICTNRTRPLHRYLDRLRHAVGRRRVDLLARLGNLGQDRLVGQRGDDLCGLVVEGDFVAFDACEKERKPTESVLCFSLEGEGRRQCSYGMTEEREGEREGRRGEERGE